MTDDTRTRHLHEQDRRHHFHAQTNPLQLAKHGPDMVERAEGIYLYTGDGRRIIDGKSGGYCTNIGYGNARLCRAAYESMQQLSFANNFVGRSNRWAAALSEKLNAITPPAYQRFFFASTGSDAVESAIKMALYYWRQQGQARKRAIIARRHSYHGLTLFAGSLTGMDSLHTPFGLPLPGMVHHVEAPYWYGYGRGCSPEEFGRMAAAAVERKIKEIGPENIAAFIGEPIQATSQMIIPPDSYWPEVQRICAQYDVLLIADEVVTGLGKTGEWFGFQSFGFEPDLFVMAKGLSSGYFPISAVAVGERVDRVLQRCDERFAHGFTNCGHPVGAAVACENIAVIEEEKLVEKVRDVIGPALAKGLEAFRQFPWVGEVRSRGIMGAIDIDLTKVKPATQADSEALAQHISELSWANGLEMRPVGTAIGMVLPMIITRAQLAESLDILMRSFKSASVTY